MDDQNAKKMPAMADQPETVVPQKDTPPTPAVSTEKTPEEQKKISN